MTTVIQLIRNDYRYIGTTIIKNLGIMKTVLTAYFLFTRCHSLIWKVFFVLAMFLLPGCGYEMDGLKRQRDTAVDTGFVAPTNFIQQIAATDLIIISNRFSYHFDT